MPDDNLSDIEEVAEKASTELWEAATNSFTDNLFSQREEFFLAFFLFVTVSAVYGKTRSVGATLVSLVLAGGMLGFAVVNLANYFLLATGVFLAFILYLVFS